MKIFGKSGRVWHYALNTALALIVIGTLWFLWHRYFSPTHIAFINYQAITLGEINKSNTNPFVNIEELPVEKLADADDYDMVFVNGMGLRLTDEQRDALQIAAWTGTPVLTNMSTNPDNFIVSVDSITADTLNAYLSGSSRANYRSMLNYVRKHIDRKIICCGEIDKVKEAPTGLLSHPNLSNPDEENVYFSNIAGYEAYLRQHGVWSDSARHILVTGAMGDSRDLVLELEARGAIPYRAEGMFATLLREQRLDSIAPQCVIYLAHGRLGDAAVDYLSQRNIPMFCPLNVNTLTDEWEADKQGMQGGFMSQSIVTPELDGGLRPYLLFGQRVNNEGFREAYTIPERLDSFLVTVDKYIALKQKPNKDKRIAIVYFKGPGEASLTASGLDVVPSLRNVLLRLGREGYNVNGLPDTPEELAEELQRTPILVYGNIALVMQPLAARGDDTFAIVHGTGSEPIEEFQEAYYWISRDFRADAIVHFGTHGGLEYTPGKQVALCCKDWPERLIGTLPHFYIYTIGNVGEALVAKRRTYACIQSHLTAPYMESELRQSYRALSNALQHEDFRTAQRLAIEMGIHRDLRLDSSAVWNEKDFARVEQFAEELMNEKIVGQFYTLGVPYEHDRIVSSVFAMATDPIAYSLLALDKKFGRVKGDAERHPSDFSRFYLSPAKILVSKLLANSVPVTDDFICKTANISQQQLDKAREIERAMNAPRGMSAMMSMMSQKVEESSASGTGNVNKTTIAEQGHGHSSSKPDSASIAKMKEAGKGIDPKTALQMAKMAGASSEALKKMAAAMGLANARIEMPKDGISSMMKQMAANRPQYTKDEIYLANTIIEVERTLQNVSHYRQSLLDAPEQELSSLVNALGGGYTKPSSGGDVISNPRTLPTGRNLYGINAETTPSESAWEKGKALAESTISMYRERHNDSIPRKVSFTFWSSEFIETEGVTLAQALYMLGVEPVRDAFGRVTDIRLISSAELGRPRIDVVVQTSGQFRDLAASRLYLLDKAITLAAESNDNEFANLVHEGVLESERILTQSGVSPREAREMSTYRVFGGLNGGYGTGIQGMVQKGSSWESESEIADTYINNMSAYYGSKESWEHASKVAFKAALSRTDAVIQPRQSNSWGALSLDHVYEFMGGMNLAVRNVTGKDPDAYLADYRNRNHNRMQEVKEAIGIESRATIFNPTYIKEKMKGGANEAASFAEIVQNTYGWNVMKPEAIENEMWNKIYSIYIEDSLHLGIHDFIHKQNPAALEQMSHTMVQSIQKGLWKTSPEKLRKLQEIEKQTHDEIEVRQRQRLSAHDENKDNKSGTVMKKETLSERTETSVTKVSPLAILGVICLAIVVFVMIVRKYRSNNH